MPVRPLQASHRDIPTMPEGAHITTLENGLTIIVREDHSAPVVSAQAWAMTGSIHEDRWLGAGMSHVLEHMLFKGTTNRPGSRIDQEVQEAGGYMNAYTSFDRTVYYIEVPNTGARTAIDILCDIMQNASLPPDEMAKEKQVILREMDMNQDDPGRRSSRRLFETAYTRSPYRYTVIGYPDIYNELQSDDVRNYYRARYAPNNVFYVVAGDVQTAEVVSQIKAAYSANKAKPLPPPFLLAEPRQTASREVVEEAPIELGHFHVAWHIPELRHPDIAPLDVLAVLLGSGRSSRLYRRVREKLGLVNSADAWTYNPGAPGLFGMSAVVDADKFVAARQAMLAEVESLQRGPITPAEIRKAVKLFIAATLGTRKTMSGQAQDLGGSWLAANDLNFSERYLAAVKRVTAADLRRVARTYLTPENRTLYALLPNGTAPQTATATTVNSDHAIQKIVLPNGLRLLVKPDHRLPFVEFRAVFQGGVLAETAEHNGVTQMLARLLLKGTKTRTAEQIATTIESVGGSIDSYGGNNSLGLNVETMTADFATGLSLLSDVVLNPVFPAAALERERQVQIAGIRAQKDELLKSAAKAMRRAMFGDVGYGLEALGTESSLERLTVADVRRFHQQVVHPGNCVLAIFGDVQAAAVTAAVKKAFQNWKSPAQRAMAAAREECSRLNSVRRVTELRDKKQAVLVIGFNGTTLLADDRHALELLQEACSDLGSRLFIRIRDQLGLAYYVGAQNFMGLTPGYFAFYTGTHPDKLELVEKELLAEAALLRADGLSLEELNRAKAKVIGQKKIARQDLGGYAMQAALDELYGLGFANSDADAEKYQNVTLDQIKAAAQKYLRPEAVVISVVKP